MRGSYSDPKPSKRLAALEVIAPGPRLNVQIR
jgi:hypothetical protein